MADPKRRISVDHDSVTTTFTEQDEAPVTPRTANSATTQRQDRHPTFDDLPSAPLPLLYSLESPITPAFQKGGQAHQGSSAEIPEMTAPVNVSPTAVGLVNGVRAPEYQPPHAFQAYPYAVPQGKEMHMGGAPMTGYRRQSRFDPMANDGEVEDDGYGELGQRHPLRRVQEEEREDGVSLPSIRNLFSVAGEKERASPVNGQPAAASTGNDSPVSSSPTMQDARSRYSGSTFSSVSDAQFGWWNGNGAEYDRSRSDSTSGTSTNGPFRSNSFPTAGPVGEDHEAKRRRSDQPASMRDPEEAARLRWQAQNRNASYPASGSIAGNGLRSLIHPPHGSYPRSVSINDGTAHPPPPPTHDDSMRPPVVGRNGSVGTQLARSFADLSAAERSARNSVSRSPSMAPPPVPGSADRRQSAFANGPLTRSTPLYESDRRPMANGSPYDASRQSQTQPSTPDRHNVARQAGMDDLYNDTVSAPGTAGGNSAVDLGKPNTADSISWSRRTSGAETASSGIHLNSDSEGSTAKGSRGKKRSIDGAGQSEQLIEESGVSESGMGGMDVLAESAERAGAAAEDGIAERDPSPPRNGTGPKYTCSFCQKTFSRPSSLRIHTYSHTGERPFVCQEPSCGRRFSVQSNLKRHAKVHALVNQQEAERLRALYAHHPHDQRHPNGLPPMHMQHPQMQGQMPGMSNSGPPPPPHIIDMRDPRMFVNGNPVMQHPAHPGPSAPFVPGSQHNAGMPPHAQAPPMPYGYPGMPNMHMAPGPGMAPPAQSAPVPPQMPADGQHGYGNYGFYDQQAPAGMSGYAPPPQQHQHTLPAPMNSLPPLQSPMPQGYHMQPGQEMADPYPYQKN